MAEDKKNGDTVPTLASQHYYLFTKEFDESSCADAMTFILERNFMKKIDQPDAIRYDYKFSGW